MFSQQMEEELQTYIKFYFCSRLAFNVEITIFLQSVKALSLQDLKAKL